MIDNLYGMFLMFLLLCLIYAWIKVTDWVLFNKKPWGDK